VPWVKFSDDWYDDEELVEAGPLALMLWPLLISWSARNLTDGRVPAGQVRRLVDWHSLGLDPEQGIAPLVANGRLQEIAGGYQITNYLKYQPSKERVIADREAAKERAAKSRERAAKSRERAAHVRENFAGSASPPVPVPVPDNPSSSSSGQVNPPGEPPGLWTKVAEKQLAATTSKVANAAAWKRKAAENARSEMGERAASLVAHYDLTLSQLVDVLLSPTNPPWLSGLRKKESA